ncbi:MAG TPA: 50S ribosomal protein L23 [Nevskiaceae bacterium]|nr:50S ribosomal protein L23 [Nevskiaceae bacterium]
MDLIKVVKKPIITEKTTRWLEGNKYTFQVARQATKKEIKQAVEKFFKVKVKAAWTMMAKGKTRKVGSGKREVKTGNWKKALVQLAEGEKIDILAAPEEREIKKK